MKATILTFLLVLAVVMGAILIRGCDTQEKLRQAIEEKSTLAQTISNLTTPQKQLVWVEVPGPLRPAVGQDRIGLSLADRDFERGVTLGYLAALNGVKASNRHDWAHMTMTNAKTFVEQARANPPPTQPARPPKQQPASREREPID